MDPLTAWRQGVEWAEKYGSVRKPVTAEIGKHRIVAVHSKIHWVPRTYTFHEFLEHLLKHLLGHEWGEVELAKQPGERHPAVDWFLAMAALKSGPDVTRTEGISTAPATGGASCWLELAYDLFVLKDVGLVKSHVLKRLRLKNQFQGARYELSIMAAFHRAGFAIKPVNREGSDKRPEFVATHAASGLRLDVEAKSRSRYGVLGSTVGRPPEDGTPSDVGGLVSKALKKKSKHPLVVFIELNLPYPGDWPYPPWNAELGALVEEKEPQAGSAAVLVAFTNATNHLAPSGLLALRATLSSGPRARSAPSRRSLVASYSGA